MSQPEVIDTIATALSESAEEPLRLIREIVDEMGPDQALTLLSETQKVEEAGGMVVARGTRRRSPGGVFFKLAKDKLPKEAKKRIFRSPHPPKDKPPEQAGAPTKVEAAAAAPAGPEAQPPKRSRQEAAPVRSMPEVFVRPRRRIIAAAPAPAPSPVSSSPAAPQITRKPARQPERPAEPPIAYRAEPTPARREVNVARRAESVPEPPPRHAPVKERVLVRVTPQSDAPAKTLDEAIERITRLLSGLREQVARAALLEAIDHFGGLPEPEPEPEPEVEEIEPDEPEEEPVDLEQLRQSLLVTLAQDLSVKPKALATALFGEDTPHNRRKARALLTHE